MFEVILVVCSAGSAAIAAVAGFGIGSILTPLLNLELDLKLAVAVVSIPHFVATAQRFWKLRRQCNRSVLLSFGLTSAGGGLVGALLYSRLNGPVLTAVFGTLLIFAGFTGVTGMMQRFRFGSKFAWVAGFLSGGFGGLVGNQGGIRAAALLTFGLSPAAFVATSTAIGLMVDVARMPIYLATEWEGMVSHWRLVTLSLVGVIIGTHFGVRVLSRIPVATFKKLVSLLVLTLGLAMLTKSLK